MAVRLDRISERRGDIVMINIMGCWSVKAGIHRDLSEVFREHGTVMVLAIQGDWRNKKEQREEVSF